MIGRIKRLFSWMGSKVRGAYTFIKNDIKKRPLTNFFLALAGFLLLIVLSNILQTPPKTEEKTATEPKQVSLYYIGSVPTMTFQAQIEKTGVVKVVSLSSGVVQHINYQEGDSVQKGSTIVSLSSNYQGGNTFSVQRQIAQTQYQSSVDTLELQKSLIQDQRNIATTSAENAEKMRDITGQSREDTRELIEFNQSLLDTVNASLAALENNPQADPAMIASLQGQKSQLMAALAQARSSLAQLDYQSDVNRPPAELARLQKEVTLKQLDLQEKMLNVNNEVARLQVQLAQVTEALMFPASPISGTVQRIFVREGQVVSPGTELAVIAKDAAAQSSTAVVYVPGEIAKKVSQVEMSTLKIDDQVYKEYPYFISSEAVQGNSYAVYYALPESFSAYLTDNAYLQIAVPLGYVSTSAAAVYVPLDAVYQMSNSAYVFVAEKGKAKSRTVELGNVYGSYVSVKEGLYDHDQVIVTRNVIDGDPVVVQK